MQITPANDIFILCLDDRIKYKPSMFSNRFIVQFSTIGSKDISNKTLNTLFPQLDIIFPKMFWSTLHTLQVNY